MFGFLDKADWLRKVVDFIMSDGCGCREVGVLANPNRKLSGLSPYDKGDVLRARRFESAQSVIDACCGSVLRMPESCGMRRMDVRVLIGAEFILEVM